MHFVKISLALVAAFSSASFDAPVAADGVKEVGEYVTSSVLKILMNLLEHTHHGFHAIELSYVAQHRSKLTGTDRQQSSPSG